MDKLEDEIVSKSKINIHKILLFRRPALIILSPLFLSPLLLHSDPVCSKIKIINLFNYQILGYKMCLCCVINGYLLDKRDNALSCEIF